MDNLTKDLDEKEIQFILNCCTINLKANVEDISRFSGKALQSKLDDIMYQNELLHKLQSKIKGIKDGKKKNKLSISGVKNVDIISDDELMERISDGTLDDPKLETTLFPNGK